MCCDIVCFVCDVVCVVVCVFVCVFCWGLCVRLNVCWLKGVCVCFLGDLSCAVTWVDFVHVCVLCLCVMLHGLNSLFFCWGAVLVNVMVCCC